MPDSLVGSYVAAKNAMHPITPWVWLFSLQTDATNAVNIAGSDVAISYGGQTYSPFPVVMSGIIRDSEGNLTQPEVMVSNITREMGFYLEAGAVLDKDVRIRLALQSDPANAQDWGTHRVLSATLTLQVAAFKLGVHPIFASPFPARRIARGRCDYVYGGNECAYNRSLPNAISGTNPLFNPTSCDLGLDTANGCRVHGLNEAANNVPLLHPQRFGGHPSVPRGPARV